MVSNKINYWLVAIQYTKSNFKYTKLKIMFAMNSNLNFNKILII